MMNRLFAVMMRNPLLGWPRRVMSGVCARAVKHRKGTTIYYLDERRIQIFDLVNHIRSEVSMVVSDCEA